MASPDILDETATDVVLGAEPDDERSESVTASRASRPRSDGIVVWALVSLGFLAYITFGTIQTRSWRLNVFQQAWTLDISPRRVLHVWTYQLNHLPDLTSEWLLRAGFGVALFLLIAGAIAGLWLLLDDAGTGSPLRRPETTTTRDEANAS